MGDLEAVGKWDNVILRQMLMFFLNLLNIFQRLWGAQKLRLLAEPVEGGDCELLWPFGPLSKLSLDCTRSLIFEVLQTGYALVSGGGAFLGYPLFAEVLEVHMYSSCACLLRRKAEQVPFPEMPNSLKLLLQRLPLPAPLLQRHACLM